MQLTLELIPSALARLLYYLVSHQGNLPFGESHRSLTATSVAQAMGAPKNSGILQYEASPSAWGLDTTQLHLSEYRRGVTITLVKNPHGKRVALLRDDETIPLLEAQLPVPLRMGNSYNLEELYQAAEQALGPLLTPEPPQTKAPEFSPRDLELLAILAGCQFDLTTVACLPLADQITHYDRVVERMGNACDTLARLRKLAGKLHYEFSHRRDLLNRADSVISSPQLDLENFTADHSGLNFE